MRWLVILMTCREALQNNKAVHGLHISLLWKTGCLLSQLSHSHSAWPWGIGSVSIDARFVQCAGVFFWPPAIKP